MSINNIKNSKLKRHKESNLGFRTPHDLHMIPLCRSNRIVEAHDHSCHKIANTVSSEKIFARNHIESKCHTNYTSKVCLLVHIIDIIIEIISLTIRYEYLNKKTLSLKRLVKFYFKTS